MCDRVIPKTIPGTEEHGRWSRSGVIARWRGEAMDGRVMGRIQPLNSFLTLTDMIPVHCYPICFKLNMSVVSKDRLGCWNWARVVARWNRVDFYPISQLLTSAVSYLTVVSQNVLRVHAIQFIILGRVGS